MHINRKSKFNRTVFLSTSMSNGGGEKVFFNLYKKFKHKNIFVTLDGESDYLKSSVRVIALNRDIRLLKFFLFIKSLFKYLVFLLKVRPTLVHSHIHRANAISIIFSAFFRYRTQCVIHGFLSQYLQSNSYAKRLWGRLLVYLYKKADLVIVVSKGLQKELSNLGVNQTKLIYNSTSYLCQDNQRCNYEGTYPFYLLAIGRLHPLKRFDKIISALADTDNVYLTIAGTGPSKLELENQVKELGLEHRVMFKGFVKDVKNLIELNHAVISASSSETFSLVLLDSLSLMRPVISSNCNTGPREILDTNEENGAGIIKKPGYGILFDVDDVVMLSKSIKALMEDYAYFSPSAETIQQLRSKFHMDIFYESYSGILGLDVQ